MLNAFFDDGKVDDSLYTKATVDFTPEVTHAALGKGIAGTMVGLALIVPLSLLLMWRRVRRRGGYGRKASAVLRSVFPLVLGLGGWFIGLLTVLLVFPTVALDDELVACISIGLPDRPRRLSRLGQRRASAARARRIGFAGAVAGALVGAWIGFNTTAGLLAVVTTIAGAVVGANLTLILLDIARDTRRSARWLRRRRHPSRRSKPEPAGGVVATAPVAATPPRA